MLSKIIEKISLLKGVKLLEKSVSYADDSERVTFSLLKISQEEDVIRVTQDILNTTGYGSYLTSLVELGVIIKNTLKTTIFPLHIIGIGLSHQAISQLKIYYTFAIFSKRAEGSEYVMAHFENDHSKEAIKKVLYKIDLADKEGQVNSIIDSMAEDGFCVEFIGINIEKERQPDLKLYFKQHSNSMK